MKKYEMVKDYQKHTLWRVTLENGNSYLESFQRGFNPNVDKERGVINTYQSFHRYDENVGDGHSIKMACEGSIRRGYIKSRRSGYIKSRKF